MRPHTPFRGHATLLASAGSLFFLLAAMCSPQAGTPARASHAVASRTAQNRILTEISFARRHADGARLRLLFERLLDAPGTAFGARGPAAVTDAIPAPPLAETAAPPAHALFERPPPFFPIA